MHPVTSELDLSVRQYERQLEVNAIQRAQLARDAARHSGRVGPIGRLAAVVRQFLDPRGYALAQALRIGSATAPARSSRGRVATVTALPMTTESESAWREAA